MSNEPQWITVPEGDRCVAAPWGQRCALPKGHDGAHYYASGYRPAPTGSLLQPRTKSERMALLTGFAMAIEAVAAHGLEHARAELRLLFESEERIG